MFTFLKQLDHIILVGLFWLSFNFILEISSKRWELSWKSCKFEVDEPCQIQSKLHFKQQLFSNVVNLLWMLNPAHYCRGLNRHWILFTSIIEVLHSTCPHEYLALLVSLFEIFLLVPMIVLAFTTRICSNVFFQRKCYECYVWVQLDAYINFCIAVSSICNE